MNYLIVFNIYWQEINEKGYVIQYINQTRAGWQLSVRQAFGENYAPVAFFALHFLLFSIGTCIGAITTQSRFLMGIIVKLMAGLAVYRAGALSTDELPTMRINSLRIGAAKS